MPNKQLPEVSLSSKNGIRFLKHWIWLFSLILYSIFCSYAQQMGCFCHLLSCPGRQKDENQMAFSPVMFQPPVIHMAFSAVCSSRRGSERLEAAWWSVTCPRIVPTAQSCEPHRATETSCRDWFCLKFFLFFFFYTLMFFPFRAHAFKKF